MHVDLYHSNLPFSREEFLSLVHDDRHANTRYLKHPPKWSAAAVFVTFTTLYQIVAFQRRFLDLRQTFNLSIFLQEAQLR